MAEFFIIILRVIEGKNNTFRNKNHFNEMELSPDCMANFQIFKSILVYLTLILVSEKRMHFLAVEIMLSTQQQEKRKERDELSKVSVNV